jgi:hypothetical protein
LEQPDAEVEEPRLEEPEIAEPEPDSDDFEAGEEDGSDCEDVQCKWFGFYVQDGQHAVMDFDEFSLSPAGIKAEGSDDVGDFKIKGCVRGRKVHFSKKYEGHVLRYRGWFHKDFNCIYGLWFHDGTDQDDNQVFWLHAEVEKENEDSDVQDDEDEGEEEDPATENIKVKWAGQLQVEGEDVDFELDNIQMSNNRVSGNGVDDDGFFWFVGVCQDKRVKFDKVRANKIERRFKAHHNKSKGYIKGKWKVPGEAFPEENTFKFEITPVEQPEEEAE